MKHLGDFDLSTVIYGKFTTFRPSSGAAYTLGGTPALSVYKDNSTTQSTTGVTLTADFDSVTGLNHFAIDTSADGAFYSSGSFFSIVITTGTVDGVSVVGTVVAEFTLRKNSALKPATAGRTLVVDAAGLADANMVKAGPSGSGTAQTTGDIFARLGAPAGASMSADIAAIKAETATILSDTNDIQTRLPAALVSGRMDVSVGAMAANVITAAATATDFGAEVADAVWDELLSGHTTVGSAGAGLSAAGGSGDPWSTALPGAYGAGSAGYILGTNLNATVSSRSTLDAAGVRTAVGLASANLDTQLAAIAGYIDTEVAAIFSRLGAPAGASMSADIAAIKAETAAIVDDTGTSGVVLTSAARAAIVSAILTTAVTESYRADGSAPTLAQALCELLAHMGEAAISGTTKTIKKFDGSTSAATFTLDSSTAPTSITRAT